MTTTAAVSAYGMTLQLSSGSTFISIAEVRSISEVGAERDFIEATHLLSPQKFKEYIAGLIGSTDVTLEMNYIVQDTTHKDYLANLQQQTVANIFRTYRLCLTDYGAKALTGTVSGSTWTTATHGWSTAQPITFTTTGVLPTSSPQIVAGSLYFAAKASGTTLTVYPTPQDAIAATNQITFSTAGTGTHTINGGSMLTFSGAFKNAKLSGPVADKLSISATLKVTGTAPVLST